MKKDAVTCGQYASLPQCSECSGSGRTALPGGLPDACFVCMGMGVVALPEASEASEAPCEGAPRSKGEAI